MTVNLNEINSRRQSDVTKEIFPTGDDSSAYSEEEESDSDAEEKELEMSSAVTCPMSKIPQQMCFWTGTLAKLEEHVIKTHADIWWRGPVVGYRSLNTDALLILFDEEIFLYHRYISKSGMLYVTVQQVGMTNRKYRYTMKATSTDKAMDNITFNFRIYRISKPFKEIFDARKCVVISADKLDFFMENDELNMLLQITEVRKRRATVVTEAKIGDDSTTSEKETDSDDDEQLDVNSTSPCPLVKIPERTCAWVGTLGNLEEHVIQKHAEIVRRQPSFACSTAENNVLIILFNKEVFLYCKHISDTGMYAVVQQVGITNTKYTYAVLLVPLDDSDNVIARFRVTKISRPLVEVFHAGKCLAIKEECLQQFVLNNQISMLVFIKVVVTHGQLDVAEGETTRTETVGTSHEERKREAPEDVDKYSTVTCPLSKVPEITCIWVGNLGHLERHVTNAHAAILRRCRVFRCGTFQNKVLLILFNQEIFLYYKHVSYTGIVYAVVQQVGVTNKSYRYIIELRTEDETVDNITFSFKIENTSQPLEMVFDARRCMAMTDESLEPFVVNKELNMWVKISEIDIDSDRPIEVTEGDNTEIKEKSSAQQEEKADSDAKGGANTTCAVACPLFKIPQYSCKWVGSLDDLEDHVISDHASILKQNTIFQCNSLENNTLLILLNKEIFLYIKYVSTSGVVYVIVQQVGITSEKYRYIVNFLGDDDTGEIILSYDVNEISEPFTTLFESGKCLAIEQERLVPFIRGNKMLMAVMIEKRLTRAHMEDIDMNSTVTCPLAKVYGNVCAWVGELGNLEDHVKNEHEDVVRAGYVFGCNSLTNNVLLLLLNKEIFLYYKFISRDGVMFVIVQQVGVTNQKYGYTVELLGSCEDDDIYRNFTAYKITEPFGPIFDNHKCMVIPMDSLGPYVRHGELAMTVGINEFRPSIEMDIDGSELDEDDFDAEQEYAAELCVHTMCPLKKIPEKSCAWIGPFRCLIKHVTKAHENILKSCFTFSCSSLKDIFFLLLLNKEIFLYYKYFSHMGIMYTVVQQVGLTEKKYSFAIRIDSPDKRIDPIRYSSIIHRISEPFQAVFSAHRCLVVSSDILEPYMSKDGLAMFVSITPLSP
jgi:hypothetical protein